ncbi:MAG: hypothetical protein MUE71_07810 [Chitinophagaceae bacterium]|jgi:hypothetical protein|nr:hypothetical protein [Chitinophagaceae bacterium]
MKTLIISIRLLLLVTVFGCFFTNGQESGKLISGENLNAVLTSNQYYKYGVTTANEIKSALPAEALEEWEFSKQGKLIVNNKAIQGFNWVLNAAKSEIILTQSKISCTYNVILRTDSSLLFQPLKNEKQHCGSFVLVKK